MRRVSLAALAAVAAVGTAAVAVTGARDRRDLAFTLGVAPAGIAATIGSGEQACQRPIDVSTSFGAVRLPVNRFGRSGPPLVVTVREVPGRAPIASSKLAGGYADASSQRVEVGPVSSGSRVAVCVRNAGDRSLGLVGGAAGAARSGAVTVDGEPADADLALTFERRRPRSTLSLVPTMFDRASLFHAGWVGTWLYWVLLALVIAGVPALLAYALRETDRQ